MGHGMSTVIVITIQCHCGADAESRTLDLSNPQPDGSIRIDAELSVGQNAYHCKDCGCTYFTGDVEVYHEGQCRPVDDEEPAAEDEIA